MTHGGLVYGERSRRDFMLDFDMPYELMIVNSYFKNKENHFPFSDV